MSITESASTRPGVGGPLRLAPVTNLEHTYALDEAWNAPRLGYVRRLPRAERLVVYWPGRERTPT